MWKNRCPTPEELAQFDADMLSTDDQTALAEHVEGCSVCLQRLEKSPAIDDELAIASDDRSHVDRILEEPELAEIVSQLKKQPDPPAAGQKLMTNMKGDKTLISEGATIGDYQIIREIGRGGMAIVFEARQHPLNRRVALKVLPYAAVLDPRQLLRFETEAMAAASLSHANIVPVFQFGSDKGVHYYAMQFIEGHDIGYLISQLRHLSTADLPPTEEADFDLAFKLASGRIGKQDVTRRISPSDHNSETSNAPNLAPQPDTEEKQVNDTTSFAMFDTNESSGKPEYFRAIAGFGIQAADALEYAHQRGIVHRDIKPSNLMLESDGKLLITDFGLARVEGDVALTMTGDVMGTLRYMSPEQATGRKDEIDCRSDIYSLGITLYELLTLKPVFPGDDRAEIMRKQIEDQPVRPRQIDKAIPADLETIVLKAIEKLPEDRYATARELSEDLRRFVNNQPVLAKRPTIVTRLIKWAQRNRAVASLAFCAAFFGGIVAALVMGMLQDERRPSGVPEPPTIVQGDDPKSNSVVPRSPADDLDEGIAQNPTRPGQEPNGPPPSTSDVEEPDEDTQDPLIPITPTPPIAKHPGKFLPGLVPKPTFIPAIGRWQIITKLPRGIMRSAVFSPDDQLIAVGEAGNVRIYDANNLQLLRVLVGHTGHVTAVDWHPDGDRLVSSSYDGTLRIWTVNGVPKHKLVGHKGEVFDVAWTPDGKTLASAGADKTIRLWNVDGTPHKTLESHDSPVFCIGWSPSGDRLASGGGDILPAGEDGECGDNEIRIWDTNDFQITARLSGHGLPIRCVEFSPDGHFLASAGSNFYRYSRQTGSMRVWDLDDGSMMEAVNPDQKTRGFKFVSWRPDERSIAAATDQQLMLFSEKHGDSIPKVGRHVRSIDWDSEGKKMVVANMNGLQLLTAEGDLVQELADHTPHPPWWFGSIDWNMRGNRIAAAGQLWDQHGRPVNRLKEGEDAVAFSSDGEWLAIQIANNTIQLMTTAGQLGPKILAPSGGKYAGPVMTERGNTIVAANGEKVFIWGTDGELKHQLTKEPNSRGRFGGLSGQTKGNLIAATVDDGSVYIWDDDGNRINIFSVDARNRPWKTNVHLHPTDNRLVTSFFDFVRVWRTNGTLETVIEVPFAFAKWSPNGEWIAVGDYKGQVQLFQPDGTPGPTFKGHKTYVWALAWGPQSEQIATASHHDSCLRVWDVTSQEVKWLALPLKNHETPLTISPTGQILHGDRDAEQRELLYLVENRDGSTNILDVERFHRLYADELSSHLIQRMESQVKANNPERVSDLAMSALSYSRSDDPGLAAKINVAVFNAIGALTTKSLPDQAFKVLGDVVEQQQRLVTQHPEKDDFRLTLAEMLKGRAGIHLTVSKITAASEDANQALQTIAPLISPAKNSISDTDTAKIPSVPQLKVDQVRVMVHRIAALSFARLGRWQEAISQMEESQRLATDLRAQILFCRHFLNVAGKAVKANASDEDALVAFGISLFRRGQWLAASKVLASSSKRGLSHIDQSCIYFYRAMCEWQLASEQQAKQFYEDGVALMPNDLDDNALAKRLQKEAEQLVLGKPAVEVDDQSEIASPTEEKTLAREPITAVEFYQRGNAWGRQREYAKAIADFSESIRLDPSHLPAFVGRAQARARTNDFEQAIADLTEVINRDPKIAGAYVQRGEKHAAKGQHDKALEDYNTALRLNPKHAQAYCLRGQYYLRQGDHDKAMSEFNRAISLDLLQADAYFGRGNVFKKRHEWPKAIDAYSQTIFVSPSSNIAYFNRASVWMQVGKLERAVVDYSRAIEINPDYAEAYCSRGHIFGKLGEYGKALADYDSAVKFAPELACARNNRAWFYATCRDDKYRDGKKAISDATKALKVSEEDQHQFLDTLAAAYAEDGDFEKAIVYAEKAIKLATEAQLDVTAMQKHLESYKIKKPWRE